MTLNARSRTAMAATAATLILAGAVGVPPTFAAESKGHCMGANACKGKSACKTAANACKGQNACKGTGFTEATAADCAKVEGAKFEPAKKS